MIDDEIDVQADAGLVQFAGEAFEAFLRSVKRWAPWSSEIEAIIDVISHAEITLIGPEWRRKPDKAVPGKKQIGDPLLNGLIRRLEPLEDRWRRFVGCKRRNGEKRGQQWRTQSCVPRRDSSRRPLIDRTRVEMSLDPAG